MEPQDQSISDPKSCSEANEVLREDESCHRSTTNRPNKELSTDEKHAKRELTKLLKAQGRIRKLETRLAQSMSRSDLALEARTRADLHRLWLDTRQRHHQDWLRHRGQEGEVSPAEADKRYKGEAVARDLVESIYHRLRTLTAHLGKDCLVDGAQQSECRSSAKSSTALKEHWHENARDLLLSMSKGTQTLSMFESTAALVGYTRQKFIERAMLVVTSLGRLADLEPPRDADLDRIVAARTVVSVGCGPGCDVVGLVSFLTSMRTARGLCSAEDCAHYASWPAPVRKAIFLDWAMPQWRSILDPLRELLVPEYVEEMVTATCDIGYPLDDAEHNGDARTVLEALQKASSSGVNSHPFALIIISYLLSETRHKWHILMDDIIDSAQLVLLLDPTAWQLHRFRQRYEQHFDFRWLDSSMNHKELQALEGRVGPAVLLGVRNG